MRCSPCLRLGEPGRGRTEPGTTCEETRGAHRHGQGQQAPSSPLRSACSQLLVPMCQGVPCPHSPGSEPRSLTPHGPAGHGRAGTAQQHRQPHSYPGCTMQPPLQCPCCLGSPLPPPCPESHLGGGWTSASAKPALCCCNGFWYNQRNQRQQQFLCPNHQLPFAMDAKSAPHQASCRHGPKWSWPQRPLHGAEGEQGEQSAMAHGAGGDAGAHPQHWGQQGQQLHAHRSGSRQRRAVRSPCTSPPAPALSSEDSISLTVMLY